MPKLNRKAILFLFYNIIIAIIFFEIILRLTQYDSIHINYVLMFGTKEYYNATLETTDGNPIKMNEISREDIINGKINFWYEDKKCEQNKKYIVFFGDSVTQGMCHEDHCVVPIDEILNNKFINLNTINFAVGGYDAPQIYRSVNKQIPNCNAELVVLGFSDNDLKDIPFPFSEFFAPNTKKIMDKIRSNNLHFLFKNNYIIRYFFDKFMSIISMIYQDNYGLFYKSPKEKNEIFNSNIRFFNKTLQKLSETEIPVVILIFPIVAEDNGLHYMYGHFPGFPDTKKKLQKTFNVEDFIIIDVKEEFMKRNITPESIIYSKTDTYHYNSLGNKYVVDILVGYIKENNLLS